MLRPAEFVEPGVVDSEVVAELVKDGLADLCAQLIVGKFEPQVRSVENRDLVGHGAPVVFALGERDALVDPQQVVMAPALFVGWFVFDDEDEVVHRVDHPLRERLNYVIDYLFEG